MLVWPRLICNKASSTVCHRACTIPTWPWRLSGERALWFACRNMVSKLIFSDPQLPSCQTQIKAFPEQNPRASAPKKAKRMQQAAQGDGTGSRNSQIREGLCVLPGPAYRGSESIVGQKICMRPMSADWYMFQTRHTAVISHGVHRGREQECRSCNLAAAIVDP